MIELLEKHEADGYTGNTCNQVVDIEVEAENLSIRCHAPYHQGR
jgi:hypothetical protein